MWVFLSNDHYYYSPRHPSYPPFLYPPKTKFHNCPGTSVLLACYRFKSITSLHPYTPYMPFRTVSRVVRPPPPQHPTNEVWMVGPLVSGAPVLAGGGSRRLTAEPWGAPCELWGGCSVGRRVTEDSVWGMWARNMAGTAWALLLVASLATAGRQRWLPQLKIISFYRWWNRLTEPKNNFIH